MGGRRDARLRVREEMLKNEQVWEERGKKALARKKSSVAEGGGMHLEVSSEMLCARHRREQKRQGDKAAKEAMKAA